MLSATITECLQQDSAKWESLAQQQASKEDRAEA